MALSTQFQEFLFSLTNKPGDAPADTPRNRIAIEFNPSKRYDLDMWMGLINRASRLAILSGITLLMLVPTGMCICAEHEDEPTSEQHEPGCPEVRKLDQPGKPVPAEADLTSQPLELQSQPSATDSSRPVFSVGHGPPRGRPLYIAQRSLLI